MKGVHGLLKDIVIEEQVTGPASKAEQAVDALGELMQETEVPPSTSAPIEGGQDKGGTVAHASGEEEARAVLSVNDNAEEHGLLARGVFLQSDDFYLVGRCRCSSGCPESEYIKLTYECGAQIRRSRRSMQTIGEKSRSCGTWRSGSRNCGSLCVTTSTSLRSVLGSRRSQGTTAPARRRPCGACQGALFH